MSNTTKSSLGWVGIVVGFAGIIIAVLIVCCCIKWRIFRKTKKLIAFEVNSQRKIMLRCFYLSELEKATTKFSDKCLIGTGALGNVYKGVFDEGCTLAVKRLHCDSYGSVDEFRNGQKILVYEYVPHGSLLEYIVGIAYHHEGVRPSIIHRDIKPSNIFIGNGYEAKVSDFGLVKSGTSQIKGTGSGLIWTQPIVRVLT